MKYFILPIGKQFCGVSTDVGILSLQSHYPFTFDHIDIVTINLLLFVIDFCEHNDIPFNIIYYNVEYIVWETAWDFEFAAIFDCLPPSPESTWRLWNYNYYAVFAFHALKYVYCRGYVKFSDLRPLTHDLWQGMTIDSICQTGKG